MAFSANTARGSGLVSCRLSPKNLLSIFLTNSPVSQPTSPYQSHKYNSAVASGDSSLTLREEPKAGSAELLPQPDTQLLSEHKRGLLQRIQSDRDILRVQQTIHGSPACPHLSRHLNLGQSLFPHLLLNLEGEHTLSSDCFRSGEHVLLLKKIVKISAKMFAFHICNLPSAIL